MKALIKGAIENFVPSFNGYVNEKGILVIQETGSLSFTVDTGFSGAIALPERILKKMKAELIAYGIFRLAAGDEVELPVFWGQVAIKNSQIETWFIPGNSLLGMEFLSLVGSYLIFDFQGQEVKLAK